MAKMLWFIAEKGAPIHVFTSKREAIEEMATYESWDNEDTYEMYGIDMLDIEDYSEEYDLAEDRGLL